jgi:ATP-dependent DNA helicase RecG
MIIENAERFGLAQLHQLRGRVGRGRHQSYCILISDPPGEEAAHRLEIMCKSNNGFLIAEENKRLAAAVSKVSRNYFKNRIKDLIISGGVI